ncbi:DUF6932 family protein [Mucilaginibacter sp. E4BP6]|uniref:DUF6932 family protein n=1 Tax=Mucilaginibacter sp. E4BP6 TaxID=2723089 RepID=UPI0015C74CA9|nr:hypothetical protein [Mucilaginibacter sp. E4BP6]NYE66664.1 hypothetical protein [Mucilaginibacter sp. E4BP6]
MIPPFNENSFLPPGIHSATLIEFKERFVYGVKRPIIFEGLLRLISDLKEIGCNVVYVDGSYVSSKERPNDVDVCWELTDDPAFMLYAKQKHPILFMMKGKRPEQQHKYCADVFPANIKEGASGIMFLDYFQRIRNTNEPKGIIKIELI